MGCHMWLYKKVSSLNKEERINFINQKKDIHQFNPILNMSREEFILEKVAESQEDLKNFDKLGISHDDLQYEIALEYSDPINVGKLYDRQKRKAQLRQEKYNEFISKDNPTDDEFIELIKIICGLYTCAIKQYKGEWYVNIVNNTYFRCWRYADYPIDNYDDMIRYLAVQGPNMIAQYGTFDKDGNFSFYDKIKYTPKYGLTSELRKLLKYLYKDNDIYIEFA